MLAQLSDLVSMEEGKTNNGFSWYRLPAGTLQNALSFWDMRDLQRVLTSLREKGVLVIASAPLEQSAELRFAFYDKAPTGNVQTQPQPGVQAAAVSRPAATTELASGRNYIPANWKPDQTTLDQLAQLNISGDFAMRQIPEFVTYWRERNEAHRSWGQKFISHTIGRWRSFEEQEQRRTKARPLTSDWQPSPKTIADLTQRKIPQSFVLDQIHEFISFWQATGEAHLSWDTKFIQRVHSLWAEMEAKRNVSHKEYKIFEQWRPSPDAMELMRSKSEIPLAFIEDAIPEFVIYWKDRGTASTTWNSLFIKHVRLQWHRYQHALSENSEAQQITNEWRPSRDVYDILKLANIDTEFANSLLPEFIIYWLDRNEIQHSWNTKFLQHVKRRWAARHNLSEAQTTDNRSTREISLEEELNDSSWAN